MKITVAVVQMEIFDGEKEKNLENALNILKSLSNKETLPDIVCLPELFTSGYDLRKVEKYAEEFPGETIEKITEITKGKFIVIGTILEIKDGKFFNTAFIIGKNGQLIGKYRKVHLFSPMLEKEFLTPGDKIQTFELTELDNLKIGIAICYDIRFPEQFRMMALQEAQIIFVPSEFPSPKRKIWKSILRTRAIENQYFVVGVNRVGQGTSDHFFGCSLVTNGDYIEYLADSPENRIFTIDLSTLNPIREKIPLLKDRRTDLYGL